MQGDEISDLAYLQFDSGDHGTLITSTEWFAPNASIDLATGGKPVGITIHRFFSARRWSITPEIVLKYGLHEWQADFDVIYENFFKKAPLKMTGVSLA